jgi:hypothetical protein
MTFTDTGVMTGATEEVQTIVWKRKETEKKSTENAENSPTTHPLTTKLFNFFPY